MWFVNTDFLYKVLFMIKYISIFRLVLRCLLVAGKENSTGFSTGLTGRSTRPVSISGSTVHELNPQNRHLVPLRSGLYSLRCPIDNHLFRVDETTEYRKQVQNFTFKPGQLYRTFFSVPNGATWAGIFAFVYVFPLIFVCFP